MPIVLGVNPSIAVNGSGSISRANGELLEDVLNQDAALPDSVEVAVFAIGINHAVRIHHCSVHAPFKAVRIGSLAADGPIRIASAALGVGVLEGPLGVEVGIKLSNKIRFRSQE